MANHINWKPGSPNHLLWTNTSPRHIAWCSIVPPSCPGNCAGTGDAVPRTWSLTASGFSGGTSCNLIDGTFVLDFFGTGVDVYGTITTPCSTWSNQTAAGSCRWRYLYPQFSGFPVLTAGGCIAGSGGTQVRSWFINLENLGSGSYRVVANLKNFQALDIASYSGTITSDCKSISGMTLNLTDDIASACGGFPGTVTVSAIP